MTKAELIDNVAGKVEGVSKADVSRVYDAIFNTITEALTSDRRFAVHGFGTFEVRDRAERQGRNPQTGEAMTIAAQSSVGFKPATALKDKVNK